MPEYNQINFIKLKPNRQMCPSCKSLNFGIAHANNEETKFCVRCGFSDPIFIDI